MSGSGRGKLIEALLKRSKSNNEQTKEKTTEPDCSTGSSKPEEEIIKPTVSTVPEVVPKTEQLLPLGRGALWKNFGKSFSKMTINADEEGGAACCEESPDDNYGTSGRPVKLSCNYIHIATDTSKRIHTYEVCFSPNVDCQKLRNTYLNEHRLELGGVFLFDGVQLYLPIKLQNQLTTFISKSVDGQFNIEIRILHKAVKPIKDCIHLYNLLFHRVMKILNYVQFQRRHYYPGSSVTMPQKKLEIWPGYVTAVNEHKGGLLLCCDTLHKVLSQRSVHEVLSDLSISSDDQFREKARAAIVGTVIVTRYNNNLYRVDDILFDKSPLSTFESNEGEITYMEYYRRNYNIEIKDPHQPLLLNLRKLRIPNHEDVVNMPLCLVPELSYITGLTDQLRTDYKLMRDIANRTNLTAMKRMQMLEKFYNSINNCPEASKVLNDWGLRLTDATTMIPGRILQKDYIIFGKGAREYSGNAASFSKELYNNDILNGIHMYDWLLLHTYRDTKAAKILVENFSKCASFLKLKMGRPNMICLSADDATAYVNALKLNVQKSTQIAVCILQNLREDIYSAIKTFCCTQLALPTQVVISKTILNESKTKSTIMKIMLQINCKLGGSLWTLQIPFKNTMICGVDVYHNVQKQHNSVAALVASLNRHYTKWYSKEVIQQRNMELVQSLCCSLVGALVAYYKENSYYPDSVVIYRDGVGDGQLIACKDFELPQLKEACRKLPNCNVKITFIVVQKRINTRLFLINGGNLEFATSGTVVDKYITRPNTYDFFLVPQEPFFGTANCVHYLVLQDENNYKADIIQRLSYKLCFLYYNWPGAIRIPACCQYAHKLAYLVGLSIRKNVCEELSLKLHYL